MKWGLFICFLLIAAFYPVRRTVTFEAVLRYDKHNEVFSYVTSVDKFKLLNPTIIEVIQWRQLNDTSFLVEYTERLSQVPCIRNYARALYHLERESDGSLKMISHHSTCFVHDIICLDTNATLTIFQTTNSDTGYKETITYTCPWFLGFFCFGEVAEQRKLIIGTLNQVFTRTKEENLT